MRKILIVLISLVVLAGVAFKAKELMQTRKEEIINEPIPKKRTLSVSLTHATNEPMQDSKNYLASVLSEKSIKVATKIVGYIEHIYVEESQKVNKGTLLVSIDERDINSNIDILRTTLAQQKNDRALAEQIYHRDQKLYKVGGLAKEQLDTSRVVLQGKRSAIKATQQKIAQLQEQKSYLKIKAPFSGVIDTLLMHKGDLAVAGKPILAMSEGEQKLRFSFAKNSASIVKGQTVYIDQRIIGNVDKILTLAQQGLVQAEVKLAKKLDLPLGSTLNIRVVTKAQKGCVVSNDTLLHKRGRLYVIAYIDGKFEAKKVKKVMEQKDKTMITPCPTEAIAKGSEVLLTQLPVYGEVLIRQNP